MSHPPLTICFVGRRDAMRSPFAARYCADRVAPGLVRVVHCGVEATMDTGISPAMAAELIVRGIDPRPTTSHMLGRRVERTDLILAMDQGVYQMVARRHPRVTDRLFTLGQFASLMDECVTGLSPTHLIEQAMAVSEEPGRVFDVPDPSSQSREQVAICAHIIEDYVDLLLDALGLAHRARRGLVEAA